MKSLRRQRGLVALEVALIGMIAMVTLFAVFEVARVFFVFNTLEEATRRGARLAAVCPVNDPAVPARAVFNNSGGANSPLIAGLSSANMEISYLSDLGAVIGDPVANYGDIAYVRARIVNLQHQLLIPLFVRTFFTPTFSATLPRESLGVSKVGVTPC